jgi:radical SAM protein with 4Fe4S-binding SPASM domain
MEIILNKIKDYCLKHKIKKVYLCLTGGEVLLLGKEYLTSFFQLAQQILEQVKIKVKFSIQTNLSLMNQEYISILKNFSVSVGTSFDVFGGLRRFKNGKTADQAIIEKMILMLKNGIHFSGIVVVTTKNYKKGAGIYSFYNKIYTDFHSLKLHPWSKDYCPQLMVSPRQYVEYLKTVVQKYLRVKSNIKLGDIDSYVNLLTKGPGTAYLCSFSKNCIKNGTFIENNGDIYPCCSLRYKDLYLGNILRDSLEEIYSSPVLTRLKERRKSVEEKCKGCRYAKICSGGCMAYAYGEGDILSPSKTGCAINKVMFDFIGRKLRNRGRKLVVA